jgi:hypothetical protein
VPAATVWQPTNQDVNTFDFSLFISTLSPGDFYMFDDSAAGNLQTASNLNLRAGADQLTFTATASGWDVTNLNGDTLALTSTTNFLFAELDAVTLTFSQESSASMLTPSSWHLFFPSGAQMLAVDVTPIPVPPAILLLASGLVGLAGIARRREAS